MRSFTFILFASVILLSQPAFSSCDEQCMREQAETSLNTKFPKYLTWKECERVTNTFMTSVMTSLDDFRSNRLSTKYKGPLKNIRAEINRQKDWLKECDVYLNATKKKRVFEDKATTEKIYAAMDSVSEELSALINGVTYSASANQDPHYVINTKFDSLFKSVDDHKTLMHLKGKYVLR